MDLMEESGGIAREVEKWQDGDLKVAKALRAAVAQRLAQAKKDGEPLSDGQLARLASVAEKAQRLAQLALGKATEIMESRIIG